MENLLVRIHFIIVMVDRPRAMGVCHTLPKRVYFQEAVATETLEPLAWRERLAHLEGSPAGKFEKLFDRQGCGSSTHGERERLIERGGEIEKRGNEGQRERENGCEREGVR